MHRKILVAALAAALALPAVAAVETYTIDPRHTFPMFEVKHMGYSLQRGRFDKTTGKVTLDTAAKKGSIEVTIDAGSVSTGEPKLEAHLKAEDFLNAEKCRAITFVSKDVRFEGGKVSGATGDLTLNCVTRPVTLEAEFFHCAPHPMNKKQACGGEFVATIKRSDWNMKYAIPAVADEVTLRINVEAFRD